MKYKTESQLLRSLPERVDFIEWYSFDREALERLDQLLQKTYPNGDEVNDLNEALEILAREVKGNECNL